MAIDNQILTQTWEDQPKGNVEDGLKALLTAILAALDEPAAEGSVGLAALTQQLRDLVNNAVPNTRKVNNKPLSDNVTLGASDVGAMPANAVVVKRITVNGDEVENNNGTVALVIEGGGTADLSQVFGKVEFNSNTKRINFYAPDAVIGTDAPIGYIDASALVNPTMDSQPTAGNTTHTVSSDGVAAAIAAAIAQAGGQVTVTTNGDGTLTIHSADDYTINLNHTHENMAKLVVCEESDLPSTLDMDTIYALVDNATAPTEIQSLWIAGLEFVGGVSPSAPRITSPANRSTIDVGSIAEGDSSVSGSVNVQARNLTQPLTVAITSGTGFSLSYGQQSGASVSIPAADAMAVGGANVTIVCTNTATNAAGGLSIGSTELSTIDVNLIANKPTYTDIAGVKLTGTQYLRLNYRTNPNTKIEIDMQFEQRSSGQVTNYTWIGTYQNHNGVFCANFGTASSQKSEIFYWFGDDGYIEDGSTWREDYANQSGTISYIQNRSNFVYTNGNVSFQGINTTVQTKTISQDGDLLIGAYFGVLQSSTLSIFDRYNIKIFSIKISENGTTLLNLVPKLEDGTVPCLYDTVNEVAYKSETSTPLEAITQNS